MATASETLRFDLIDNILLIVHADVPPSDADWARLMMVRDANRHKIRGTLVVAPPRASINAAQRADVVTFLKASGTSIAVMTESVLIRGLARAVAFLGLKVQAFALLDTQGAFECLAVSPPRRADLLRRIELLKAQLAS